jgi:RHS repeat-associated protein
MTSATMNSVTTTFAYRGDGLRDSRTTGANTTTFTWDIAAGLPVVIDDGARYVYGAGLEAQVSGSNTYYYLADGLGSTMKTVDASGNVVNSYTYDVYGKKTSSTGTQANEFDFAGQQTDPTGLQYLRARYMDPETGIFLSRDPLAIIPGWRMAPYSYASDSPTMMTDPIGLCPWGVPQKACDAGSKVKDGAKAVGGGLIDGGGKVVAGVASAAKGAATWFVSDYHWADVAAVAGTVALATALVLASGGTASPLAIGLLATTGLSLQGVGLIGLAAQGADCKQNGGLSACGGFLVGLAATIAGPFGALSSLLDDAINGIDWAQLILGLIPDRRQDNDAENFGGGEKYAEPIH